MIVIARPVWLMVISLSLGCAIVAPAIAAPAVSGETLFRQRCQICHSVSADQKNGVGPNLRAVVGRKAASGTFNYSNALRQSNLIWSPTNIDRYLTAPTKMVPGTRMVIAIPDKSQRQNLIKYLSQVK